MYFTTIFVVRIGELSRHVRTLTLAAVLVCDACLLARLLGRDLL